MKKQENRPIFFPQVGNFARKTFAVIAASAMLFGASAQAQPLPATVTLVTAETYGTIPSGLWAGLHLDSATWGSTTAFNLGGVNFTAVSGNAAPGANSARAILTDVGNGAFTFGSGQNIVITRTEAVATENVSSIGFMYFGKDATEDTFTGSILGGANITARNTLGRADGVDFRWWDDPAPAGQQQRNATLNGATIRFGKITANAGTEAYGFTAGTLTGATGNRADITIGSIKANAGTNAYGFVIGGTIEANARVGLESVTATAKNTATAVEIQGNVLSDRVNLGNLFVEGGSDARGLLMGNIGVGVLYDITGSVTLGTVDVTSTDGNAFGVEAGNAILNLRGDITATANNGTAYGIFTSGDATLNILSDLKIMATAANDDAFGVWAGGDLFVEGSGRADLGVVMVRGDAIFGDGENKLTVIIDKDSELSGWGNELHANTTLVLRGDARGQFQNLGEWIGERIVEEGAVVGDTFTDWIVNAGFLEAVAAKQARMSDGYLAAFTMHNRFAAWNAVRDRMVSGDGFAPNVPRGHFRGQSPCGCGSCGPINYSPCDPVFVDPCGPDAFAHSSMRHDVARGAWVNYTGRSNAYRSSFHNQNWRLSAEGVQAGADLFRTQRGQLGVLFGYESGRMGNDADRVKMDDVYFGAYLARVLFNGADIRGVFAYGFQDYDMRRFVSGNGIYTSSFKGNTMEANLEIGRRFSAGGPLSLRPVVAADVFNNKLKGAAEADGITYGRVDLTQVFLRTGTELRYQGRAFTFNSGVYYAYDLNGKELKTGVRNGDYHSQLFGTKLGRELLTFNLGGEYQLAQRLSVFGGYQGEYMIDRTYSRVHNTAYIGAGFKW